MPYLSTRPKCSLLLNNLKAHEPCEFAENGSVIAVNHGYMVGDAIIGDGLK